MNKGSNSTAVVWYHRHLWSFVRSIELLLWLPRALSEEEVNLEEHSEQL